MATISTMFKVMDGFTSPIQKNIDIMTRMVDVMEQMNSAGNMPGLEDAFNDIRTEIGLANHEVDEFNQRLQESGDQGQRAAHKLDSGFGGFQKTLIVLNQGLELTKSLIHGVSQVMKIPDQFVTTTSRLNMLNDGLQDTGQLQDMIFKSAQHTRSSYQSTAEAVAQMGFAAGDALGNNNQAMIRFTELMNKSLAISGAEGAQRQSVLLQTSQALAKGKVQGQEFNAIMENAPYIMQKMADHLGVSVGELKEMGSEGELTSRVLIDSLFGAGEEIDTLFKEMPDTFEDVSTKVQNSALNAFRPIITMLSDGINSDGFQSFVDTIIVGVEWSVDHLTVFMQRVDQIGQLEGFQAFASSAGSALAFVGNGIVFVGDMALNTAEFFIEHWSVIEPILWAVGLAVGGITTALLIYKGVVAATAAIEAVKSAAQMIATGATIAETAAQWGLNAALLACPATWVVIAIIALIAILIALGIWLYKLWQNNIDFRVGVIGVWNNLLGFFDQVPIFFQWVGNGILDALSNMKVGAAMILQGMVNNAIDNINKLIALVNNIPGVSIDAIGAVDFGTRTAIEEETKQQQRAADLQASRDAAALKAAERENQLAQDAARWRQEAAEKEAAMEAEKKQMAADDTPWGNDFDFGPMEIGGGNLDKVGKIGKEVDISNQSLQYLRDIAELQALEQVNAYSTVAYESFDEARLSDADANLLKSAAHQSTNVYYLSYSGGVRIRNDIQKGEDYDSIRRRMEEEIDNDIEVGLSDIDKVVNG